MLIRSGWVVLAATIVVWVVSTWGMALIVFLLAWWVAFVLFGGLRHGIVVRGVRSPLRGFGEEQGPGVEEGPRGP